MPLTPYQIKTGLRLIEEAAAAGTRAPTNRSAGNPTGEITSGLTTLLLKQGHIRIEVYAHNWRVIEMLKGEHAGKRTAPPPYKYATKPYLILPRPVSSQDGQS